MKALSKLFRSEPKVYDELRVQLENQKIYLAIVDYQNKQVNYLNEIDFKYNDFQEEEIFDLFDKELKQKVFKKVSIFYNSDKYVLIPEDFFQKEASTNYFAPYCKIEDNETYQQINLKLYQIIQLSVYPIKIKDITAKYFNQNIEIIPLQSVWLSKILHEDKFIDYNTSGNIHLYIHKDDIDICILHKRKLLLCNHFSVKNIEDTLYYSTYSLQQLDLNPQKNTLILYGNTTTVEEMYELGLNYFADVVLANHLTQLNNNKGKKLKAYQHPILLHRSINELTTH